MSAPGQDAAQPTGTAPDGQGQSQDRTDSYEGILGPDVFNDAPEELRDHLVNYVKTKVDPFINQRFQESSEFQKTWEPFSQIEGLTDLHPEDVDHLVELGYALAAAGDEQHPGNQEALEAVRQTWEAIGEQFGFTSEADGEEADGDDEPEYMTREEYEAERAAEQQQQQLQQTTQQIQEIRGHVDKLPIGEAGSREREKAERALYSFMLRYDDGNMSNEDVVKAAYEDYTDLVGGAQSDLLENHEESGTTVNGGRADNAPEEVHGWREADKLAKARLTGAT